MGLVSVSRILEKITASPIISRIARSPVLFSNNRYDILIMYMSVHAYRYGSMKKVKPNNKTNFSPILYTLSNIYTLIIIKLKVT